MRLNRLLDIAKRARGTQIACCAETLAHLEHPRWPATGYSGLDQVIGYG